MSERESERVRESERESERESQRERGGREKVNIDVIDASRSYTSHMVDTSNRSDGCVTEKFMDLYTLFFRKKRTHH